MAGNHLEYMQLRQWTSKGGISARLRSLQFGTDDAVIIREKRSHVQLVSLLPRQMSSFLACNSYDCVAPYVDIILHRGRFWAKSAASGSVKWCCFRSCWTVLSHVMRGRPSCLFRSAGGEANRILLASSMRIICPNRVSRRDWIIAVSLGWFVSLRTSSFRTNWYHLISSSICRHHWSSASILHASVLDIAQQSEPYRNIGKMHVLYSLNFVEMTDSWQENQHMLMTRHSSLECCTRSHTNFYLCIHFMFCVLIAMSSWTLYKYVDGYGWVGQQTLSLPPLSSSLSLSRESTIRFTSRWSRRPKSRNIVEPPDNTMFCQPCSRCVHIRLSKWLQYRLDNKKKYKHYR